MVRTLKERYGVELSSIEAALGPAIGPCCYEVGPEVADLLVQRWGSLARPSLRANNGKSFLDLRQMNASLLKDTGVPESQIFRVGPCTGCATEDFFSYRRERGETGRQLSFIGRL
jgi:hypothetical protein